MIQLVGFHGANYVGIVGIHNKVKHVASLYIYIYIYI